MQSCCPPEKFALSFRTVLPFTQGIRMWKVALSKRSNLPSSRHLSTTPNSIESCRNVQLVWNWKLVLMTGAFNNNFEHKLQTPSDEFSTPSNSSVRLFNMRSTYTQLPSKLLEFVALKFSPLVRIGAREEYRKRWALQVNQLLSVHTIYHMSV